jgi:hypothetical protein
LKKKITLWAPSPSNTPLTGEKKEIQWASPYLPLMAFIALSLLAFNTALATHNLAYLKAGVGLMIALAAIYRMTFYSQYLEACRHIYFAGIDLEREALPIPSIAETTDLASEPVEVLPVERQEPVIAEAETVAQIQPPLAVEEQPTLIESPHEILSAGTEFQPFVASSPVEFSSAKGG